MRKIEKLLFTGFAVLLFSHASPAAADQCADLSKTQAEKAVTLIQKSKYVYSFCQPCGDTHARKIPVKTVVSGALDNGYFEVMLNGNVIDLAYTYDPNRENLAHKISCGTVMVSRTLPKELTETATLSDNASDHSPVSNQVIDSRKIVPETGSQVPGGPPDKLKDDSGGLH